LFSCKIEIVRVLIIAQQRILSALLLPCCLLLLSTLLVAILSSWSRILEVTLFTSSCPTTSCEEPLLLLMRELVNLILAISGSTVHHGRYGPVGTMFLLVWRRLMMLNGCVMMMLNIIFLLLKMRCPFSCSHYCS